MPAHAGGIDFYKLCYHNFWHNFRKLAEFLPFLKRSTGNIVCIFLIIIGKFLGFDSHVDSQIRQHFSLQSFASLCFDRILGAVGLFRSDMVFIIIMVWL